MPARHTPAVHVTRRAPQPAGLSRLRAEHAAETARLKENISQLENRFWWHGRDPLEYRFDFGGPGWHGHGGYPADRAQDKSKGPIPYLTEPEYRNHLAMARDLLTRNHLGIGFLDHVCRFIGPVSVQFVRRGQAPGAAASGPVDADGEGAPDGDPGVRECAIAWEEFVEENDWGQGETDREFESLQRSGRDGESGFEFFKGARNRVPKVRHLEPELIRSPLESPRGYDWATREDWGHGVLTHPDDAETELALWYSDPDGTDGRAIPASRYVRTKNNVDRCIKRGLSDFFCVEEELRKVSEIQERMAHCARVLAGILWWEQNPSWAETQVRSMIEAGRAYQAPSLTTSTSGANFGAYNVESYPAGSKIKTEAGRQVVPPPTAVNTPNLIALDNAVLLSTAFRFGLPGSFVPGKGGDSFASSLVTGSPFVRIIEGRQKKQQGFTRAVVLRVLELCEESGRLRPGTAERVKPVLTSQPIVIADEEKQSRVFLAELAAGVADPYKRMKEKGDEPKELLANLADFKRKLAEMGGQQPPGGGGPFGGNPPGGTDPTPTPPGSAGGDGSSPNADPMGDIFGESRVSEGAPGPPPRPGLVWKDETHRWVHPESGEEHEHQKSVEGATGWVHLPTADLHPTGEGEHEAAIRKLTADPDADNFAALWRGDYVRATVESRGGGRVKTQHFETIERNVPAVLAWAKANLSGPAAADVRIHVYETGGYSPKREIRRDYSAPAKESRVFEGAPGPPPRPGLVWNDSTHRWRNPDTGEEREPDEKPAAVEPVSIPGHDLWRGKLPKPDAVTARPKSKKARADVGRAVQNAWTEARSALAAKHGTRDINDLMTPEEKKAEGDLVGVLRVLASGNEYDGPFDLGPVSDQRYAGYYRAAVALVDKLRASAAAPKAESKGGAGHAGGTFLAEASARKDGEEWETNGRRYKRVGGKTVRVKKKDDKPVGKSDPPAPQPPAQHVPASEPATASTAPHEIDWKHKDANHPIAKAVSSHPVARQFAERAQEHAALAASAKEATAEKDRFFQEWRKVPQGDLKASVEAGSKWKAAWEREQELQKRAAESATAFRAELFAAAKTENGVAVKAETTARRSWWNPVGSRIASKEEMLGIRDEHAEGRKKSAELNEAAMKYAGDLVSSVFESRGTALDVEVGFSRNGRAFLQPAGPTVAGVRVLNAKPVIGMGIKFKKDDAEDSAIHELGHLLEESHPDVKRRANEFLTYRLGDEKPVDLGTVPGGEMMKGEKGRKDDFDRAFDRVAAYYVGKTYDNNSTEVVSMGLEKLHRDPIGFFAKDPEYAGFVLTLLRADK